MTRAAISYASPTQGGAFDRVYVVATIDAANAPIARTRASRYDFNNRLVSQTSASGQVTTYAYDANGNTVQITDPAGNVTTRQYDSQNRLLSETTPDAGTNSYAYDANGNLSPLRTRRALRRHTPMIAPTAAPR